MLGLSSAVLITTIVLATIYGVVTVGSLGQLVRIHYYSKPLTPQKGFHFLVFLVALVRLVFFAIAAWRDKDSLFRDLVTLSFGNEFAYIIDEVPGILFFTTYALLLSQWADIYHSRQGTTRTLRRCWLPTLWFFVLGVSSLQVVIWVLYGAHYIGSDRLRLVSACVIIVGLVIVAIGFAVYGHLMYKMLSKVPIELAIRSRKTLETRMVTAICTACFLVRAVLVVLLGISDIKGWENFNNSGAATHVASMVGYYALLEVLPLLVILYLHRRVPPRMERARSLNGSYASPKAMRATPASKLIRA